jgi:hypothetical protein
MQRVKKHKAFFCRTILKGTADGVLQLVLIGFWTLFIVIYSTKQNTTFQELDLLSSSGET